MKLSNFAFAVLLGAASMAASAADNSTSQSPDPRAAYFSPTAQIRITIITMHFALRGPSWAKRLATRRR